MMEKRDMHGRKIATHMLKSAGPKRLYQIPCYERGHVATSKMAEADSLEARIVPEDRGQAPAWRRAAKPLGGTLIDDLHDRKFHANLKIFMSSFRSASKCNPAQS